MNPFSTRPLESGQGTPRAQRWAAVGAMAALLATTAAQAQTVPGLSAGACGMLTNAFGPWDYRPDHYVSPPGDQYSQAYKLNLVQIAHFTPEVEALVRGHSGPLGGDLDYTLRAFPNHARALVSMERLGDRLKVPQVQGAHYSVECYFIRALTFAPDDSVVRMLFANYLKDHKRTDDALRELATTRAQAGDDAFTHYNLGRLYLEMGQTDLAVAEAQKALELGFPRTDLKEQLIAANKWVEPAASAPR